MNRWRMVQRQNDGPECVSTVVLSEEEAREHLLLEASMHERFGWTVTVGFNLEGDPDVVIARTEIGHYRAGIGGKTGPVERIITAREFAALEDVL